MSETFAKHERWIREVLEPRCPELVGPVQETIAAYDRIQSDSSPETFDEDLDVIRSSARSTRRPLYEFATNLLGNLTASFAAAREIVTDMMSDRSWQVRFNAIFSLRKETPPDFVVQILNEGLKDKSARVRQKAADWAYRVSCREAVPALTDALESESDEQTQTIIDFSLRLLRDGYIFQPKESGGYILTLPHRGGTSSEFVSEQTLKEFGQDALINDRKENLSKRPY